MPTQRIFASRTQYPTSTYIGNNGSLFYNEVDGELRLSDGVTPGGVAISVRADLIVAQRLTPALDNNNAYGLGDETHRWYDLHIGDGGIHYNGFADPQYVPYRPGAQVDDIIPALDNNIDLGNADHRFANLYLGTQGLFLADTITDANINIVATNGTLFLNGAQNLRLGNLAIRDTTLTSANTTLDISVGDAGDTGFFYVKRKAQIDNTTFSSTQAMLGINASGTTEPATIFPDTLVQATSRPNKNSRVVQRAYGSLGSVGGDNSYAVWASYAARGSVASPAALKADDILARLSANGYGTTTWGSGGARVEFVALENFTDTAKGTKINFWTTPVGQIASQNVASINSVGVVAASIEFTGDSTVQTTAGIPLTAKAVSSATYVATLGVDGKLDATQIPSSLTGAIVFKGTWNATTNTPTLSNTLPAGLQTGWEYIVEVSGTRDIGDGSKTFLAGDFVIYDGTHWKQVPSGNAFISLTGGGHITVNQTTGAIVLDSDATPNATTSTIVSRDASGNFAANVITANLTGVVTGSVSGNAGSVTNGVYTTGNQNIGGTKTFTSIIQGTATNALLATTATFAQSFNTGTLVTNAVNATTATNSAYAYSFNTGTLVTTAVTAGKVSNALTAGYGLAFSAGTTYDGSTALTLNQYYAVTGPVTVSGNAYALNLGTSNGMVILDNSQANFTITISNPVVGKVVRVMSLNMKTGGGATTVTVSGLTAANSSNGNASFQGNANGAVAIVEFICTTTATSGVYMNTGGAK
jgi:hypothetical protein